MRDLALQSGMDEIYRLVYDPASTHLHGTWMSIQRSNLVRCVQPMHRFHRIPEFFDPPLNVNTLDSLAKIYETTVQIGVKELSFPRSTPSIKSPRSVLTEKGSRGKMEG